MNTITIELCQEDRNRLDKIIEALSTRPNCASCVKTAIQMTGYAREDAEQTTPAQDAPNAPETTETTTPPETQIQDETPTAAANTTQTAPETSKPSVTLEQIQQKVMALATMDGGAKKAKVREVISAYGAKVSDLKDQQDKWAEVWAKLTALEKE